MRRLTRKQSLAELESLVKLLDLDRAGLVKVHTWIPTTKRGYVMEQIVLEKAYSGGKPLFGVRLFKTKNRNIRFMMNKVVDFEEFRMTLRQIITNGMTMNDKPAAVGHEMKRMAWGWLGHKFVRAWKTYYGKPLCDKKEDWQDMMQDMYGVLSRENYVKFDGCVKYENDPLNRANVLRVVEYIRSHHDSMKLMKRSLLNTKDKSKPYNNDTIMDWTHENNTIINAILQSATSTFSLIVNSTMEPAGVREVSQGLTAAYCA